MTAAVDTPVKLNVGCGTWHVAGFVNIDQYTPADLNADARQLPYSDGEVDELHAAHLLEHLGFADAKAALEEWHRVLRAGGKLTLVVPNMDWVCSAWLHGSDRGYARQIMFGSQEHIGEYHKNGWAKDDLVADVEEAGFTVTGCVVRWTGEYGQESIILEATA